MTGTRKRVAHASLRKQRPSSHMEKKRSLFSQHRSQTRLAKGQMAAPTTIIESFYTIVSKRAENPLLGGCTNEESNKPQPRFSKRRASLSCLFFSAHLILLLIGVCDNEDGAFFGGMEQIRNICGLRKKYWLHLQPFDLQPAFFSGYWRFRAIRALKNRKLDTQPLRIRRRQRKTHLRKMWSVLHEIPVGWCLAFDWTWSCWFNLCETSKNASNCDGDRDSEWDDAPEKQTESDDDFRIKSAKTAMEKLRKGKEGDGKEGKKEAWPRV